MGEEKGKLTKKILHIGHLLLEFLRNVVKAIGKPDRPHDVASKAVHNTGVESIKGTTKTTGKIGGKAAKGVAKSAVTKSSSTFGSSLGSSLSGLGSATSSTLTSATGLAGAIVSVKTLAIALVAASLFTGGLGTYSYVTHQEPLNAMETLFNVNGHTTDNLDKKHNGPDNPVANPTNENQGELADQAGQSDQPSQTNQANPPLTNQISPGNTGITSGNHNPGINGNSQSRGNNGEDTETESTDQSIDYEIP